MKAKRIVITGGPATGKTTLVDYLQDQGYECMPEVSRSVILAAQEEGIDQLFLKDPILFSERLLEGRLKQFNEASALNPYQFYDRGLPDVTAYMDYLGTSYSDNFRTVCQSNRYDTIFLLPPWEKIYEQDNERYETFDQALRIYEFLLAGYRGYGYDVIEVPVGSIEVRSNFIISEITTAI